MRRDDDDGRMAARTNGRGDRGPLRVAVVGKGGAGKSFVAGTLARLLGRSGRPVLALDSDLLPGLAAALGADPPARPPLLEAAERGEDGRWRLKRGVGPVRAVQRFATQAPDGVRLLQCGKVGEDGLPPIMPAVQAFYRVVHRLARERRLGDWAVVGDLPAGPRQAAFDWAPYARTYLVVAEPTVPSMLAARRVARVIADRPAASALLVANKVRRPADARRVAATVGLPLVGTVPADRALRAAEQRQAAPLDAAPDAPAVRAVADLAGALRAD